MAHQIIGEFQPGQSPKIRVEGLQGTGCVAATAPFEKALGKTTSVERTGEYYAQAEVHVQSGVGGDSAGGTIS